MFRLLTDLTRHNPNQFFLFNKIKVITKSIIKFAAIILFISACTTGHCPSKGAKKTKEKSKAWVYKYDQSKQCQKTEGISLELMLADFAEMNILVYESKKKYDGLMRIQACGAYTGLANLFLIPSSEVEKALSKGFQKWDF